MSTVTSKDGTTIDFDVQGQGPAVILVGGAYQYRAIDGQMNGLATLLAKDFTVYNYDRRGRGESGNTKPYAKEREIEDIAALIDEAGGSAFVFAMSSGAALALDAAESGAAIPQLVLYELPAIVDDSRPTVPADYVEHLTQLIAEDKRDDAMIYFMTKGVGVPEQIVEGMRQSPMWDGLKAVAHTLPYDAALVADLLQGKPLPTDRWTDVKIPILVLDGGASPAWLQSAAEALGTLLKADHQILEGQSHAFEPEVMVPVVASFFKSNG